MLNETRRILGPRALTLQGSQAGPGVIRLAVSTTAASVQIPASIAGKQVVMYTEGDVGCDILFGVSGTTVTYGQASGVSGGVVTVHAESGARITSTPRRLTVPKASLATHLAFDASGTGALVIEPVE